MTEDDTTITILREIAANTKEIASWLQVAHGRELRERLEHLLDSKRKQVVYEYSDGNRSTRVLAQLAGTGDRTVRDWWHEWLEDDIVETAAVQGRFRRRYSLRKLGIKIPDVEAGEA